MAEDTRHQGRNGEMWQLYCRGWTQERIAQKYGISQPAVCMIIKRVRDSIPEDTRLDIVKREADFLDDLRDRVMSLVERDLPPVLDREGNAVIDPSTGEIVRDIQPRLNAVQGLLKVIERHAKLLGTDAATKVDATVTQDEDQAARALAADAARRLSESSQGDES